MIRRRERKRLSETRARLSDGGTGRLGLGSVISPRMLSLKYNVFLAQKHFS